MRTAVRQCYGWSMPYGVSLHGEQDLDAEGNVVPRVRQRLAMLTRDLVIYGTLLRQQFVNDVSNDAPDTFAARYGL
jgi:azobenzene reductase